MVAAMLVSLREFATQWRPGVCRFAGLVLAALAVLCAGAEARTARIVLAVTGDERMSDDLKQLVETFEKEQPLEGDSLALLQGAQAALAKVNGALRSRGFYDAMATATIDNHPVDEAAALDAIDAHPDTEQLAFALTIDTGPRFKIGGIAIRGPGPQSLPAIDMGKLGLAAGDPADAASILTAEDRALAEFRKQGHALAVVKREVVIDHATREAEITFTVDAGPIARMGAVRFSGTEKVDTTYLQRRVPFKEGELYDPAKVDALRGRLTSLGVFNAVRIKPATDARRQRRAADRCRAHRPAAALDRLRRQLRDAARLRRQRLLGASQPVRPGRKPAALGRDQPYRPGRRDPATPASPSGPTSASPTGGCPARTAALEAAALREVLRRLYAQGRRRFTAASTASSRRTGRCGSGLTGEISQITRNGITMATIACSACQCRCC